MYVHIFIRLPAVPYTHKLVGIMIMVHHGLETGMTVKYLAECV